ncbi:MAG: hypothetical protein HGA23_06360 [Bacteroidales bacterium]|nr:hypothetical protein [Bacteroidales bacterium]
MITVYTGNGKGKTTSAIGKALFSLDEGKKIIIIQFLTEKQRKVYPRQFIRMMYHFDDQAFYFTDQYCFFIIHYLQAGQ